MHGQQDIKNCVIVFCLSIELNYSLSTAQNIETFDLN